MLDSIIVGAIVLLAAFFVGKRLYKQFSSKSSACGCSGCGDSGCCSSIKSSPDSHSCESAK
ncbi:FeoB-associated Cys-rich membrane protein [Pseudodesulfovibrio piezophilus]|uniref:FeoB-associated Cys-rich membrane protein n=1 Tax=Pseudodesulfovibrio piezophilus TaxID=879567 RepID=UPI000A059467|nr:FeoB-associated Cys-rich membrane protein [Pseudodesulfovibrio piezophilus]